MRELTELEAERYSRQLVIPEIGLVGQKKLKKAKVLIIGAGGLGSPVAYYLTAAGIGTIGLVDNDQVELSNLQRQILHSTADLGRPKVVSAQEKLKALNPELDLHIYHETFSAANASELIKPYDIIVDALDNFPTRFTLNDACVLAKKPFVHGAVIQFFGQILTYVPGQGPCYRCFTHQPPAPGTALSLKEAGVLAVLPGIIGTLQATEVLKYFLGLENLLTGRLLTYDALAQSFSELKIAINQNCAVCGSKPSITKVTD